MRCPAASPDRRARAHECRAVAKRTSVVSILCVVVSCGGGESVDTHTGGVVLQTIEVTPASPSLLAGNILQLTATGHYSDGSTSQISGQWSSSSSAVATVDVYGKLDAIAPGSSRIGVTSGGVEGSTVVSVSAAPVVAFLYSFSGLNGSQPNGPLLQANDGNFYGTTRAGGPNTCFDQPNSCGVLFKITPAGNETVLYSFGNSPTDGFGANAPLVQTSDGSFYGTTTYGGTYGAGTVFKMSPDGFETVLYSFGNSTSDGVVPAALIRGSDGNFYGTTAAGAPTIARRFPVRATTAEQYSRSARPVSKRFFTPSERPPTMVSSQSRRYSRPTMATSTELPRRAERTA